MGNMLNQKQKFRLMFMYMRGVMTVSGLGSVAALSVLAAADLDGLVTVAVVICFLKLFLLASCIGLFLLQRNDSTRFFYVNLGVSPTGLMWRAVAMDLAIFFFVMVILIVLRYGCAG